jgi:mannose-6-phosphate isomerase-like protein (cupin superfamily)
MKKTAYLATTALLATLGSVLVTRTAVANRPANAANAAAKTSAERSAGSAAAPIFVRLEDVKWERIVPDLGTNSPEITILHMDPKTRATQLLIRVPKDFYVPRHWHSANETHTIISGTFVMECEGKQVELGPGSFNHMPNRMIHHAWTKPGEGALLFITVDSAWDVNWVNGPPTTRVEERFRSSHRPPER